jgi:hypothetical protein
MDTNKAKLNCELDRRFTALKSIFFSKYEYHITKWDDFDLLYRLFNIKNTQTYKDAIYEYVIEKLSAPRKYKLANKSANQVIEIFEIMCYLYGYMSIEMYEVKSITNKGEQKEPYSKFFENTFDTTNSNHFIVFKGIESKNPIQITKRENFDSIEKMISKGKQYFVAQMYWNIEEDFNAWFTKFRKNNPKEKQPSPQSSVNVNASSQELQHACNSHVIDNDLNAESELQNNPEQSSPQSSVNVNASSQELQHACNSHVIDNDLNAESELQNNPDSYDLLDAGSKGQHSSTFLDDILSNGEPPKRTITDQPPNSTQDHSQSKILEQTFGQHVSTSSSLLLGVSINASTQESPNAGISNVNGEPPKRTITDQPPNSTQDHSQSKKQSSPQSSVSVNASSQELQHACNSHVIGDPKIMKRKNINYNIIRGKKKQKPNRIKKKTRSKRNKIRRKYTQTLKKVNKNLRRVISLLMEQNTSMQGENRSLNMLFENITLEQDHSYNSLEVSTDTVILAGKGHSGNLSDTTTVFEPPLNSTINEIQRSKEISFNVAGRKRIQTKPLNLKKNEAHSHAEPTTSKLTSPYIVNNTDQNTSAINIDMDEEEKEYNLMYFSKTPAQKINYAEENKRAQYMQETNINAHAHREESICVLSCYFLTR